MSEQPLLVKKCNCTTAGLDYLEVSVGVTCSFHSVNNHLGEWHNPSAYEKTVF
jgi:hypothetical protein